MYERTPALPPAEQQEQQKATGTKPTTKAKQQNYILLILSKLSSMETYWVFACAFPFVLVGRLEKAVMRLATAVLRRARRTVTPKAKHTHLVPQPQLHQHLAKLFDEVLASFAGCWTSSSSYTERRKITNIIFIALTSPLTHAPPLPPSPATEMTAATPRF